VTMWLRVEGGKEIDMGPAFRVMWAFRDMARIAGPKGDKLYPQLYYAPQSNEEPVPRWVFKKMQAQARLFLKNHATHGDVTYVLETIAGSAPRRRTRPSSRRTERK
jgi:hypothetical protein